MTASKKFTWGLILNVSGWLLFCAGIALSFTVVGACVGVPMALLGFPMGVWGTVWTYQGHSERQQESIAAGIRAGLTPDPQEEEGASQD